MTGEPVVVVGVGMMSVVGVTAAETASAVRAGIARFVETDLRDRAFESFVLGEVLEDALPPLDERVERAGALTVRMRRLLRLASGPLREALAPLRDHAVPIGVCLALPETDPGRPLDGQAFLHRLALQLGGAFDPAGSDASHRGRAGGLVAIGQAVLTIQSGRAPFMLAGGIDTYRDLFVLGTLDAERRVKSARNRDGFIPGEGAAFLLLASERAAAARGLAPLARVSPVVMGFEAGHLYGEEPYRGDGLASTIGQLVASGVVAGPVSEVYSSMNGENHWAKEWGVAYIRHREAFLPDHRMHHVADSMGDTGAACGPLMVGLAGLGIARRYRRSPALVYGSSDRGSRAALVVSDA